VVHGKKSKGPQFKRVLPSQDLEYALQSVSRHPTLIAAATILSSGPPIERFRAAGQLILEDIHARRLRYSEYFFARRIGFRKQYVSALAIKSKFDDGKQIWSKTLPLEDEAEKVFQDLQKELDAKDQRYWASLARLVYRRMVVHM
jgi:hypothetical protein